MSVRSVAFIEIRFLCRSSVREGAAAAFPVCRDFVEAHGDGLSIHVELRSRSNASAPVASAYRLRQCSKIARGGLWQKWLARGEGSGCFGRGSLAASKMMWQESGKEMSAKSCRCGTNAQTAVVREHAVEGLRRPHLDAARSAPRPWITLACVDSGVSRLSNWSRFFAREGGVLLSENPRENVAGTVIHRPFGAQS